jgi:hypothetical protein
MIRVVLVLSLLSFSLFAKECYFTKKQRVCFKAFFDTKRLKDPKHDEKYYKFKDGNVYTFNDKIKITLNYMGAILYIVENFEVEFFDKKDHDTYILKVKNSNELFAITTNLNELNSVKIAEPLIQKKEYKPLMGNSK